MRLTETLVVKLQLICVRAKQINGTAHMDYEGSGCIKSKTEAIQRIVNMSKYETKFEFRGPTGTISVRTYFQRMKERNSPIV